LSGEPGRKPCFALNFKERETEEEMHHPQELTRFLIFAGGKRK
jgi:hypothetical protein